MNPLAGGNLGVGLVDHGPQFFKASFPMTKDFLALGIGGLRVW
jgi:hypothetical protein